MPSPRLIPGTILRAIQGEAAAIGEFEVQVLNIGTLSGGRCWVQISDSSHYVKAVTSSALYSRVVSLKPYQCIVLKADSVTVAPNGFTILDFIETHDKAPAGMIGGPVDVTEKLKHVTHGVPPAHSAPAAASASYAQSVTPRSAYGRSDSKTKSNTALEPTPLASLDPYAGRFSVKIRVLSKSEVREYTSATGPGKLFSMDWIDNAGTTMRATAFRHAADAHFDTFRVGACYIIANPQLRAVKESKFSRAGHELHLTQETTVTPIPDELSIPRDNAKFVKIASIANMAENTHVDVVGIITRIDPPQSVVMRKTSRSTTKRVLTIRDDSGKQIEVTIWGNHDTAIPQDAHELFKVQSIHSLSVAGALISGFDGRGLSTTSNTRIVLDSNHPEAVQIRNWFAKLPPQAQSAEVESLTTRGVIAPGEKRLWIVQVNEMRVEDGATEFAVVRANLKFSADEERLPWYPGCTATAQTTTGARQCGKKMSLVPDSMHGEYSCGDGHVSQPQMRYNLSVTLTDHSGHTFATAFEDQAKVLLDGADATTLSQMVHRDVGKLRQLFERCSGRNWTVKLRIRAQPRVTQTGETVRAVRKDIVALNPLPYEKEQKQITAEYAAFKKQREAVAEVLALAPK